MPTMPTVCPECDCNQHGHCIGQGCDCPCQALIYDDYVYCMACGQPFNDGGGLYCSSFCEGLGNPDYYF